MPNATPLDDQPVDRIECVARLVRQLHHGTKFVPNLIGVAGVDRRPFALRYLVSVGAVETHVVDNGSWVRLARHRGEC